MTSFGIANADNLQSKEDFVEQKVNEFKHLKLQQRELQKQMKNSDDSKTTAKSNTQIHVDALSVQIDSLQDEVKLKMEKSKSNKFDKVINKIGKTFLDESSKNFVDSPIVDVFVDPVGEQIVIMTSGEVSDKHKELIRNTLAKNVDIIFVEGKDLACSNRGNCTPVRGGVTTKATSGVTTKTSTLGFFAT